MNEEKKKKPEKETEAKIVEIPTQYGVAIELPDGKKLNELQLLMEIYNDIQRIKKSVA